MEYQLDPGIFHTDLFLALSAKAPQYKFLMFLYFDVPCELPELTTNLSQLLLPPPRMPDDEGHEGGGSWGTSGEAEGADGGFTSRAAQGGGGVT